MSRGKKTNLQGVLISMLVLGLAAGFVGCSDSDNPVTVTQTGTITVDVSPDGIGASWTLASADKLVAVVQGDSTLSNLAAGQYTITWNLVSGWTSPTPGSVTVDLTAGDHFSYTGAYMQTPGTVVIDVNDDDLNATWTLTAPDGVDTTGQGDATFTDMTLGAYTIAWGDVANYITPATEERTVTNGGTIIFAGMYVVDVPVGFAFVPAGGFTMGSPEDELGRDSDEALHTVTLTNDLLVGATEVTEKMWDSVMGGASTSLMPKSGVSWDDAVAFCNAMSVAEGYTPVYTINGTGGNTTWNKAADGYRLPTEAEWEYACRAGSNTAYPTGSIDVLFCEIDADLDAVGWYCANSDDSAHEAGLKDANYWGLHDMQGNLWEWCWDAYLADNQSLGGTDPANDGTTGDKRVMRGGCNASFTQFCRAAARSNTVPTLQHALYGFRVVRTIN